VGELLSSKRKSLAYLGAVLVLLRVFPVRRTFVGIGNLDSKGPRWDDLQKKTKERKKRMIEVKDGCLIAVLD